MVCASIDQKATGDRIRALITESEHSTREVIEETGVTKASVYNWMAGRKLPSIDNLVVLSELLGVGLDDIIMRKRIEG